MTCGIYKLKFNGTDKVYIGQSVNIEKRYREHCQNLINGSSNIKLQNAYIEFGRPILEILSECSILELDTQEDECIDIYNSVNNGYNIYSTANQVPSYTGYGYGNSKYSKESIIEVFTLLCTSTMAYTTISKITNVSPQTICNINLGKSHYWLKEEYYKEYTNMISLNSIPRDGSKVVSDKLSAKNRGIVYPNIRSPSGEVYTIDNAYKFAKEHNLAPNHFQEVLNKHRKSHKGWKLA